MTQNDDTRSAPGVFLAVPSRVTHAQLAQALQLLGFAPGVVRELHLWTPRGGTAPVVRASVEYVDRRDAIARSAVATVEVPVWRDDDGPTMTP